MKHLLFAAALSLAYCDARPPSPAPAPPDPPAPPAALNCDTACAQLRLLGCAEAAPTDDGASCEMVCQNADASKSPLPVACISRAQTCAAAELCE